MLDPRDLHSLLARSQDTDDSAGSITSGMERRQQQQQQQPTAGPSEQSGAKPKKPSMTRRATSSKFPRKGEEFSVDDAEDEVQLDKQQTQQSKQQRQHPLRRKSSTVRRRPAGQQPPALTTIDSTEDESAERGSAAAPTEPVEQPQPSSSSEETVRADEDDSNTGADEEDDDEGDVSDAESFTLRDRQDAINVTHPFGIRIWKPALYKKGRSVQNKAEADIHSSPGSSVSSWLLIFNLVWTLCFGWWLALIACAGGVLCALFGYVDSCMGYAWLLFHLAAYLFYPFGRYVKLLQDDQYVEEDEGEGRSISEYEQWQSGDIEEGRLFFGPTTGSSSLVGRRRNSVDSTGDETTSLLGREGRASIHHTDTAKTKRRLFGRGQWTFGRVLFFVFFYLVLTPALFLVSGICWFLVFTIPMGKVTLLLFDHLRRHPLALSFHSDNGNVRRPGESSSILLCTYRAVGIKYWKYTIDGTNIFLINLLGLVAFTIFDYFVLVEALEMKTWLTDQFLLFTLALLSIIPLAYFIGQAVASISAQSSMGVGATINAFFSTIVEVFLYCVALKQGKAQLVEGSIIGSIFAGILFLPGLSMCFGALKRKTQRFNVRSAGVTSTMLLFAVIGAFGPTLFYQIYGSVSYTSFSVLHSADIFSTSFCVVIAVMGLHHQSGIAVDATTRKRQHYTMPSTTKLSSHIPGSQRPCCLFRTLLVCFSPCEHTLRPSGPSQMRKRRKSWTWGQAVSATVVILSSHIRHLFDKQLGTPSHGHIYGIVNCISASWDKRCKRSAMVLQKMQLPPVDQAPNLMGKHHMSYLRRTANSTTSKCSTLMASRTMLRSH
jgi:Ca2+:H+ antiporter